MILYGAQIDDGQVSMKPHVRAASSTSSFASFVLPSAALCATASHTARAVFRSALLRNCTTVLNRNTRVKEHMTTLTASRVTASLSLSVEAPVVAASTEMSEARRAGSSEEPKSAGRDVGWIEFSRAQRVVVSEDGMLSHARVNSKRVSGAADGARVAVGAGAGSLGRSATGTSRVLNTVSFPDMRKIPPPTRPTDFASRACLASLKDEGVGFGAAGAGAGAGAGAIGADFPSGWGGDVEEGWRTRRELMGFKRRSSSPPVGWVMMGGRLSSSSTMVIGTRRSFGGAVAEEDDAGGGVAVKTPVGADRCPTMRMRTVRKGVWNAAKANRRAYCLSLPVHNKFVHARELGFDSFVVRLEFECPLKIIMGLAELLEGRASLGPAKERFYVFIVGKAEHGGAVTLGVFIPTVFRDTKGR